MVAQEQNLMAVALDCNSTENYSEAVLEDNPVAVVVDSSTAAAARNSQNFLSFRNCLNWRNPSQTVQTRRQQLDSVANSIPRGS